MKAKIIRNILISVSLIILFITISIIALLLNNKKNDEIDNTKISNKPDIIVKELTIKSKTDYNKKIKYIFENESLKKVYIYEQFETEEQYINAMEKYNNLDNTIIMESNLENHYIALKKLDFGTDANLSYEEIYNKYLVEIIGAYELIE